MANRLEDDVYFILKEGEVVDWTTNISHARKWAESDSYRYVRYSKNEMERKPFEKVQGENYQRLDTITEYDTTTNE